MRRPRVAVSAAVLATPIRIDRVTKANVGTVIFGQYRFRMIGQDFGLELRRAVFFQIIVVIFWRWLVGQLRKAVRDVAARAAACKFCSAVALM